MDYSDGTAEVVCDRLNIRRGPGKGYGVIDVVNRGEKLHVIGSNNDEKDLWLKLDYKRTEAWITSLYVKYTPKVAPGRSAIREGSISSRPAAASTSTRPSSGSTISSRPATSNTSTRPGAGISSRPAASASTRPGSGSSSRPATGGSSRPGSNN